MVLAGKAPGFDSGNGNVAFPFPVKQQPGANVIRKPLLPPTSSG
jgi:hypothetical protein